MCVLRVRRSPQCSDFSNEGTRVRGRGERLLQSAGDVQIANVLDGSA
jgi:hypothetical protein